MTNNKGGARPGAGRPKGSKNLILKETRKNHQLRAYPDEWELIRTFANLLKRGDSKEKCIDALKDLEAKVFMGKLKKTVNDAFVESVLEKLWEDSNGFETISEWGSVKIGNDNFTLQVPNDYGDGKTAVAIVDKYPEFEKDTFWSEISGKFYIYKSDDSDEIACELDGTYNIYCYEGLVFFEKKEALK